MAKREKAGRFMKFLQKRVGPFLWKVVKDSAKYQIQQEIKRATK